MSPTVLFQYPLSRDDRFFSYPSDSAQFFPLSSSFSSRVWRPFTLCFNVTLALALLTFPFTCQVVTPLKKLFEACAHFSTFFHDLCSCLARSVSPVQGLRAQLSSLPRALGCSGTFLLIFRLHALASPLAYPMVSDAAPPFFHNASHALTPVLYSSSVVCTRFPLM